MKFFDNDHELKHNGGGKVTPACEPTAVQKEGVMSIECDGLNAKN
jgi:hypothetical protein